MADLPRITPPSGAPHAPSERRAWTPPTVEELPPLVDLTLDSSDAGDAIDGSGGSGGVDF